MISDGDGVTNLITSNNVYNSYIIDLVNGGSVMLENYSDINLADK